MREIKFRGKCNNEWVYGHLLKTEEDDYGEYGNEHFDYLIQANEVGQYNEYNQYYITDNETIGQYTGFKDKNGVKIYEGDIVNCYDRNFIVEFRKERGGFFPFACGDGCGCCEDEVISSYGLETSAKVIGNIYDNPELLKESD